MYRTLLITLALMSFLIHAPTAAADAVLDAKREAAAKLLKDGKPADAQKLYEEIVAADDKTWSDHFALAKIYDKSGETPKAVASYQHVVKLLKNNTRTSGEKSALSESQKRVDTLDQVSKKLDEAVREFARELSKLESEAQKSDNKAALEKVRAMQLSLLLALKADAPAATMKVQVYGTGDWMDTGVDVTTDNLVSITSAGQWSTKAGDGNSNCGPDGNAKSILENGYAQGLLIARNGDKRDLIAVGSSTQFRPTQNGRLFLICNDHDRKDNSGYLVVNISVK